MIKKWLWYIRLFVIQSWFSYRALFSWSTPFNYIVSKFGFGFFSMIMFIFISNYAGLDNTFYIVIGNILLMPATSGITGVSMTIANERNFSALSSLLASPAPNAPIFLGRTLFHIIDSFVTVSIALPVAFYLFKMSFMSINLLVVILCILTTSLATSGMGLLLGSISLVNRDGWMITQTVYASLFVLVGANFPIEKLPHCIQTFSQCLPMTRGIFATRMALSGADLFSVSNLLIGEMLVGVIYTIFGYLVFNIIEKRSRVSGNLDHL